MSSHLAGKINRAVSDLEELLERAQREFERDDLPDGWDDDLSDADEAAQNAASQIGSASDFNEYLDKIEAMLVRIGHFEEAA